MKRVAFWLFLTVYGNAAAATYVAGQIHCGELPTVCSDWLAKFDRDRCRNIMPLKASAWPIYWTVYFYERVLPQ